MSQKVSYANTHTHCALGAIEVAAAELGLVERIRLLAAGFLGDKVGGHIPRFNDAKETTKEDVLEALMLAAKDLRNQG
jgi:hypothetical protein